MDLDLVDHPGRFFSSIARDLKSLALSNIQFFQNGKQSHHAKFHMSFSLLYEYLDVGIEPSFRELSKLVHLYDFSPEVKGNGYRSLLQIVQKCCLHLTQLSRYISSVKDSMLFRKKFYAKELEAYVSALGQLRAVLYYALKLINYCQEGELFADEEKISSEIAEHLMMEVETLNQECFYGRCLGFQFCESMHRPILLMNIAMASYSEGYLESSGVMQVATSVVSSGRYFMDPELRASQLAKVTRTADIKFCKAFWSISELGIFQQLPSMVCPSVEVDEYFPLGPDAFELPLLDGSDTVVITPPCAHIGPGHVNVRLLSSHLREGQEFCRKPTKAKSPVVKKPRTPGLVIHFHGGGFIAQSSKSHEVYLRDWAKTLDVPILSVDYSLAPELPFPRALEDCFYAYAWAVKNCLQLGSTGERIIMVGDSAGGNLAISTAMRAASFRIRSPEGLLGVYPVTMVRYTPSPARLLSLLDPVLPVGLVSRCLAAYAGVNEEHPLSSPSIQEFQSEANLSLIQMQSVETSDKEWVIIGQDEEECLQVERRLEQPSPGISPQAVTRSVVDNMKDSFTEEEMLSSSMEEERRLYRSDTVESEEVEIFSQLQTMGSCMLNKDGICTNDGSAGTKQKTANQPKSSEVAGYSRLVRETDTALSFVGFQEKAKSVMEGAQSVFTSLSSYIPSRGGNITPSMDDSLPSVSHGIPSEAAEFYANRSISSDTVDPVSKLADSPPIGPADRSESVVNEESRIDDQSEILDCITEETFSQSNKFQEKTNSLSIESETMAVDDAKEDKLNTSLNRPSPESKPACSRKNPLSSNYFNSALLSPSPVSEHCPLPNDHEHKFDSISLASDLSSLSSPMKPNVGVSPNKEIASGLSESQEPSSSTSPHHSHSSSSSLDFQTPESPRKVSFPSVPSSLRSKTPNQNSLQSDLPPSNPDSSPPFLPNQQARLVHSVDCQHQTMYPTVFPSLPPENSQLLQDAISTDVTNDNTDIKTQDSTCSSHTIDPSTNSSSPKHPPAKPPTDLNLPSSIRNSLPKPLPPNPSPSPEQLFSQGSSDLFSADADMESSGFESSCLEFLGPNSSTCDEPASLHVNAMPEVDFVSGMFRSESAPAMTTMLSPSPATSPQGVNATGHPFPNGVKAGMSPSDFKRQTFTSHSPVNTMRKALVVRNPYMSPLMADEELLRGLPHVCLVGSHLDPLLDDAVMFAKKLRSLDMSVELHLVEDLPHGFLNFSLASQEAKKAAQFCSAKLQEMLHKES